MLAWMLLGCAEVGIQTRLGLVEPLRLKQVVEADQLGVEPCRAVRTRTRPAISNPTIGQASASCRREGERPLIVIAFRDCADLPRRVEIQVGFRRFSHTALLRPETAKFRGPTLELVGLRILTCKAISHAEIINRIDRFWSDDHGPPKELDRFVPSFAAQGKSSQVQERVRLTWSEAQGSPPPLLGLVETRLRARKSGQAIPSGPRLRV